MKHHRKFRDIIQLTNANYVVNQSWYISKDATIKTWIEENEVNLDPPFQRGYVWNDKQKTQYIEWVLRGGRSGKDIYFNHPGWMRGFKGEMVIVDGKQRISAVIDFIEDKIPAYGTLFSEYDDRMNIVDTSFIVHVADLKSERKVLQWYIQLNTGGTMHTDEEIEKVRKLMADAR